MRKRKVRVSAPGKVIISGEHAAVYGYPILSMAINKRLTVTIEEAKELEVGSVRVGEMLAKIEELMKKKIGKVKITVSSEIPIGAGMGSSAALAAALAGAYLEYVGEGFDKDRINWLAFELEKMAHGNPSGADNTVVTMGGLLWMRKEATDFRIFMPVKAKKPIKLNILLTGQPRESTKEMIGAVADKYKNNKDGLDVVLRGIEKMTKVFLEYFLGHEVDILTLIKENEILLEELGVVSETTKKTIREIESKGGAAKVSGAGGKKENSGIILVYGESAGSFPVEIDYEGVKIL